jgi:hypothetical protein
MQFLIAARDMVEAVTGQRPVGYNCNWLRRGPNTLSLLQELGYVYHIDDLSRDEPFIEQVNGKDFVVVPYTLRNNDILLIEGRNYSPSEFIEQIKSPQMVRAWNEFLRYAKGQPGVAFGAVRIRTISCQSRTDSSGVPPKLMLGLPRAAEIDVGMADMAHRNVTPARNAGLVLQYGFFSLLETACTNIMRRFSGSCLFFQRVSECPAPNLFKLIALLLSFPCFEISHLFFKFAYAFQHRRALILCRKRGIVSVDQLGLEFQKLPLKRRSIAETYHSLRDILSRLESRQRMGNGSKIGHQNRS